MHRSPRTREKGTWIINLPSVQLAPVTLRLRNESTWPLRYTLRLLPASIRPAAAQAIAPWIGRTVQRGTLAPWHIETLSAHVAITSAGAYQLGDWACEAAIDDVAIQPFFSTGRVSTVLVVQA